LSSLPYAERRGKAVFRVYASPGASRTEAKGLRAGALRVRIAAAPEKGKANRVLEDFIAESLGCARTEVEIISGAQGRNKTVSVPLSCGEALKTLFAAEEGEK
jgi:uncharacterized protein (TIGR00251 family)